MRLARLARHITFVMPPLTTPVAADPLRVATRIVLNMVTAKDESGQRNPVAWLQRNNLA